MRVKRTDTSDWPCTIARSVHVLGDHWNLLIIRQACLGTRRFDDFQAWPRARTPPAKLFALTATSVGPTPANALAQPSPALTRELAPPPSLALAPPRITLPHVGPAQQRVALVLSSVAAASRSLALVPAGVDPASTTCFGLIAPPSGLCT